MNRSFYNFDSYQFLPVKSPCAFWAVLKIRNDKLPAQCLAYRTSSISSILLYIAALVDIFSLSLWSVIKILNLFCVFKLFDFDLEVKPMLEVLVGKTIEQSLLEVMEEEELANLRASQYAYEELRNVELAEVQRLEEQERRHREEKVENFRFLSQTDFGYLTDYVQNHM